VRRSGAPMRLSVLHGVAILAAEAVLDGAERADGA
jgi:hypothetical protein